MEGLSNRMATNHLLSAQQNVTVQPHYGGIPMSQQRPERLPPSYEEAQLAAQNADMQQINNMEAEKHAIYRHPLFPLLVILFEKCEQTTATSECPPCPAFDNEIKDYIIQHNREGKPFFTEDADLDTLIVKAIQVLRIHLLELEKVNELCKDFCQRYITCLKGKMQSENLLRSPLPTSFQQTGATMSVAVPQIPGLQPQQATYIPQQQVAYYTAPPGNPCTVALATPSASVMGAPFQQQQQVALTYAPQGQVTPGQQLVITQVPQQTAVTQTDVAQTTVSYVAPVVNTTVSAPTLVSNSMSVGSPPEITVPSTVPLPALDSPTETPEKKRTKRGVLPKQATNIMKTWLFQHLVHPYPTEDEKRAIASQTNLTILQVNNWFINARRRILQPMLDASNPDGPKAKKSKIQRFPAQRFWPETLVPNQFSNVPMAPMTVIPAGMQVQTVQHVTGTTVAMPTTVAVPPSIVPTSHIQTVPSSAAVQHQPVPGTNMVVVTLPPSASQVTTLSETESTTTVSSQQTMITSTAVSQVDSACLTSGSMPTMLVHVQDSHVPSMSHNGSIRGSESTLQLVASPHHVATTVMQEGISTVEGLQLDTGAVHTGLVN